MWNYLTTLYTKFIEDLAEKRKKRWGGWEEYTVNDEGFTQLTGDASGQFFPWSRVRHVGILTTSDGPFFEDVFFIIQMHGDKNICLTQAQSTKMDLLKHFDKLPGFNYEEAIKAMTSCTEASFNCWDESWA